uniref:Response receiver domain-containing protein n=1 Tax=uncultured marine crenarchaeote E6-3G TaxID=907719 RepID=G9BAL6_9ARCH|nr:hypothetical protein E6-3G_17 [uncultured marine crenarchaeote E6-3G]
MLVPGSIVIIDDDEKETKNRLIDPLRLRGELVFHYKEVPDTIDELINPRLVIIDWDLSDSGRIELLANGGLVAKNLRKIIDKSSFLLIIIWSIFADNEENRINMKKTLVEMYNGRYSPDNIDDNNIKIVEEKLYADDLIPIIEEWINNNHAAGLIFEWEKSLMIARDSLVSKVADCNIQAIINMMHQQYGIEGLDRYISNLFFRILNRELKLDQQKFYSRIKGIHSQKNPKLSLNWYSDFHYLQSYCSVSEDEKMMTGDLVIIDPDNPDEIDNYGLILNTHCDFVQKNVNFAKILRGTKIIDFPPYEKKNVTHEIQIPFSYGWTRKKGKKTYYRRDSLIEKIVKDDMKKRYYRLLFIKDKMIDDSYYHVIFDFNRVNYCELKLDDDGIPIMPVTWKRVCRLDSPIIEDVLQKYSSYCSRIGIPDIPRFYINKELEKMKKIPD